MTQQTPDQVWQQFQTHMKKFFDGTLSKDGQCIEDKPRDIALLPEMLSESHQKDFKK
jgi:hypothetical protein